MKSGFVFIVVSFLFFNNFLVSQTRFNFNQTKSSKIKFQLINNIIIIPVEINGTALSFVLDTGVSQPILFNLVNMDSLQIRNTKQYALRGLGNEGEVQAIRSKGNTIKIGEAIAVNRDIAVVFDEFINFTPRLGVPVHGIIGYDLFRDFVVEINYGQKYMRLYKPETFKYRKNKKWKQLSLDIISRKSYLNAEVVIDSVKKPVKLLIDTGGSDALWLFEDVSKAITLPKENYFYDFLGKGLSGAVYGIRSKVDVFGIDTFELKEVNVAYPDTISLNIARNVKERNGSVSGNILKRFNLFFDYYNKKLLLKKNSNFKTPFYYNNSGITLEQRGLRLDNRIVNSNNAGYGRTNVSGVKSIDVSYRTELVLIPSFQVVELRTSSNANAAGIRLGDIVISINSKKTSEMTLQEVNAFFYDKKGKGIRLEVERDGKILTFQFQLDDVFNQKKEPSN